MNSAPNFIPILIISAIVFLLDFYAYQSLRTLSAPPYLRIAYWLVLIAVQALPVVGMLFMIRGSGAEPSHKAFIAVSLFATLLAVTVVITLPLLVEDIARLVMLPLRYFTHKAPIFTSRTAWVSLLALALGGAMLLTMTYGMLWGKYRYQVRKQTVYFEDLPQNFDGFRILQLSDFHAGSTNNFAAVQRGIDLAKAQNADIFIFSGDMVNNSAEEFLPWVSYLAQIKVPEGKFSVLGNHDYGDYQSWSSKEAKAANLKSLIAGEEEAGFRVLLDECATIERDGQKIAIVGVQNIGMSGAHFHAYGDLQKALIGVDSAAFKILISHDPSHWDKQVSAYPEKIQLTLSGHTHGFQFGVENRFFRWSPVQWVYPYWAGLYEKNNRYLYVNRGFGFIPFFLGRVGIMPEITVLELKRKTGINTPPLL